MAATGVTRTMLSPRAGLQLPNALVWHAGFARAVQELCVARKGTAKPARVVRAAITGVPCLPTRCRAASPSGGG